METYAAIADRRTRLGLSARSVFAFGVLSLALPFTTWLANAGTPEAQVSKTVSYEVHDLTNARGVERVYRRLQAAAHDVCAGDDIGGVSTARAHQLCFDAALNGAVARVDAPLLTERHARETEALVRIRDAATVASR
jgi:UrcA family protein